MTDSLLTVICVYADYHRHLVERAAASVAAQTLPCQFVAVEDTTGKGPAAGRNAAASLVSSPFVTFLDADDTLLPDFVFEMLSRWSPGHYVYCDWVRDGVVQRLPDRFPAHGYQLHVNTCVIARETFLKLGGYKTQMEFEDTEFWFRAMARGLCGIHCPLPLVEYSADGRRSEKARGAVSVDYLQMIYERYAYMAGCRCGGTAAPDTPAGAKLDGDVLVRALWGGNFVRHGLVTGREYARTGNGKLSWMDPRDATAAPQWYQIVEDKLPVESVDLAQLKQKIQSMVNGRG